MHIEIASEKGLAFLQTHDRHLSKAELAYLISRGHVYILKQNETIIGWLRWNLFWDNIPFMNMLYILEDYRRQGRRSAACAVLGTANV